MALLTRDDILNASDLAREEVDVPEWGGAVLVRGLTGRERDAYESSIVHPNGRVMKYTLTNMRARLVALSVIDEAGARLFSDSDIEMLGRKSAAALQRVFEVAQRLSGLSEQDMDELAKNSESGPSDDSGSG